MLLEVAERNRLQYVASESCTSLRIVDCKYFGGPGITLLLELNGERLGLQGVTRKLQSIAEAKETYWVDVRNTRFLCMTLSNELFLCSLSRAFRVLCVRCPYNQIEKRLKWEILAKTSRNLNQLLLLLRRQGVDASIISESPISQNELLTARQREVFIAAIENGFFDFPRKVGLSELSGALEIDPSTLSETLRIAERKIIRNSKLIS